VLRWRFTRAPQANVLCTKNIMPINLFLAPINMVDVKSIRRASISFSFFFLIFVTQACASEPEWNQAMPKHHTIEGFRNYPIVEDPPSLGFSFYLRRFISSFSSPDVPKSHIMTEKNAISLYKELNDKDTITWIGQSTLLTKIDGKTIITDPFFTKYASPSPIGPRRYVDPGLSPENLPTIDVILVSHNHYDHLDSNFIESLDNKDDIQVLVPLKLKSFFSERNYKHVHELDWYEADSIYNIRFTSLPTVHYSGRGIGDKNKSLWCSWAISSPSGQYYFIGDSAYSPSIFKEIGKDFGSFDLAMVTIGAYGSRKYGVNNHTTPEEAVTIGKEINAKALLGIHWGTIDLSDEDPWEPPKRFEEAAKKSGYSHEDIWIFKIGETRKLPGY
jgi:N-acyl-phosphatidylethanolamine-hydrolysing phospholipase D